MTEGVSRPRVLQMMLSTQPGGAETFFEKFSIALSDAGVSQCLVIEPDADRAALFRDRPNVDVATIRFGGLGEWQARRKLKAVFRGFAPDVALTWMNRASRRVPSGYCPVVGRLGGYYKLKHYRRCDHLVGITPDLVSHIEKGGWPEDRVGLIPNFGEVPSSAGDLAEARTEMRSELGIPEDASVLLALGRLHAVKAHDTLLKALARLPGVHLLLAGEGPLRDDLVSLAKELGLADHVHFLGWRRDVDRLFAACDISVFPSRYEPNGTVVMESWAHRRPLVASRAKGPEWLVKDGVDGLLFPIDSVDALVGALGRVLESARLREQLVRAGWEKFEETFSRKAVVQSYLGLFERLVSGSGSSGSDV